MEFRKYLANPEIRKEYSKLVRERMIEWRKEPAMHRVDHPTNLSSARRLGYKAKQGIIVARVRLQRGQKMRPRINKGRRSKHMNPRLTLQKSYQAVAEQRAAKHYINLEVLNSYKAGKDGLHYWYEVILVDPSHPAVKSDKKLSWISSHRRRAFRGLTSAARKSRGLRGKGKGFEKSRPSRTASRKRRLYN